MIIKREDYKLGRETAFGRLVFRPPFKASSAMQNEARFVYIFNGKSRLYSPLGYTDLSSGESILMKCENFVNTWLEDGSVAPNEVLVIQINPEIIKMVYGEQIPDVFSIQKNQIAQPVEKIAENVILSNFAHSLKNYLEHPKVITEEFIRIKVRELINILVNIEKSEEIKVLLANLFTNAEHEFKEIIHSHIYEDLNLEDLAFFAGLSLSSFKRKFKNIFGTSPNRYIIAKRLEKALNLLKTTNQRISEVAFDCGFNDVAYFSRAFRSAYEKTPSEYRKNLLS